MSRKLAGQAAQVDVADHQIGLAGSAVGDHRARDARDDGLHVGLVEAEHGGAVERHAIDELRENVLNLLERGVMVEVLAIDGGHHGDHRREQQEGAVALVGFDHHVFAAAEARRGAGVIHAAADDEGGIEPGGAENRGDHRGGGGLAVRAGDGDAVFQAHQFGQHLGARNDRESSAAPLRRFRDCRGGWRSWPPPRARRERARRDGLRKFARPRLARRSVTGESAQVGTGDGVAQGQQHLGDAAHADAADAHQMNALEIVETDRSRGAPPPRSRFDDLARGVGPRQLARARAEFDELARIVESAPDISRARRSPVSSGSGISRAAPARDHFLRVAQLVAIGGGAKGNEDARRVRRRRFPRR